jgi:hypothetical protein
VPPVPPMPPEPPVPLSLLPQPAMAIETIVKNKKSLFISRASWGDV